MRVTIEEVERIARLARLEFSGPEKEEYRVQMEAMLDYAAQLDTLDTEGVEPTFYVQHSAEALREDAPEPSLTRDQALRNAPATSHGFFSVPKVIQSGEGKA